MERRTKLEAESYFKKAGEPVREYLKTQGLEDDDGNLYYEFPSVVDNGDGKKYVGVELRKSKPDGFFTQEDMLAFARKKGLEHRLVKMVPFVDMDDLYVLQQEGKITEAELRGLMQYPKAQYSLWPIVYEPPLEDE
jgi:hypothetical protein